MIVTAALIFAILTPVVAFALIAVMVAICKAGAHGDSMPERGPGGQDEQLARAERRLRWELARAENLFEADPSRELGLRIVLGRVNLELLDALRADDWERWGRVMWELQEIKAMLAAHQSEAPAYREMVEVARWN